MLNEILNAMNFQHSTPFSSSSSSAAADTTATAASSSSSSNSSGKIQEPFMLNSYNQLRSAISFAESIQHLLLPPPKWTKRDIFVVPTKDMLLSLTRLKAHTTISRLICFINMKKPLANEAILALSLPLDTFIRKGIPALADSDIKADQQKHGLSTSSTSSAAQAAGGSQALTEGEGEVTEGVGALYVLNGMPFGSVICLIRSMGARRLLFISFRKGIS